MSQQVIETDYRFDNRFFCVLVVYNHQGYLCGGFQTNPMQFMSKNQRQRGAQGKHAAVAEREKMAQQVMDLFQVDYVLELPVHNYHQLPECVKREITDTLKGITLCKVPARDQKDDLIFYLRKEAQR